ncbi:MAG: ABC transporter ATP-binding protein [Coriobacteriales bacterium]|jgi:NitT/TauT family transport system ATP-binding protein|nr:ABC transporter ATP-binding protein [Coriobacteriales bacterium]
MSHVQIDSVCYSYQDNDEAHLALENVSLAIDDGEFICLIGHSGCGKSTLLSLIAGLNRPTSGTIMIDGSEIAGPSTKCAVVFQDYSLFPWMSARKNIAFNIRKSRPGVTRQNAMQMAMKYLEQTGMQGVAEKYPYQLSGGMRQRVAIAKALSSESDLLLLDEPFGALDAKSRAELQNLLAKLWGQERKRTVIFVTHDINEAIILADRVVFMRPRKIAKDIDIPIDRPRNIESIKETPTYLKLRENIVALFYLDEGKVDHGDE